MEQWRQLTQNIIDFGEIRADRTGVGVKSIFGGRVEFDVRKRFPLVSAKETRWKTSFIEMLWFLRGNSNVSWLHENGCHLWDEWANEHGSIGSGYPVQWRNWYSVGQDMGIDQIATVIHGIRTNPYGRRHLLNSWNVAELGEMTLPPCHYGFQCYASTDGFLDLQVNQRSWDVGLGAPFNIAQYALLLHLLARATERSPRKLSFVFGDAHIYTNHLKALAEVLTRPVIDDAPQIVFNTDNTDIDGYKISDFDIVGYTPHPFVKLPVAV